MLKAFLHRFYLQVGASLDAGVLRSLTFYQLSARLCGRRNATRRSVFVEAAA